MIEKNRLPKHIAIIMDGNGRWARKRHLPHAFGHRQGAKGVDVITQYCARLGVEALTLYSFSAENWKRPPEEINALMKLLRRYLQDKYKKLQDNDIRLNAIGRLDALPGEVRSVLFDVIKKTSGNKRMVLTLALNYGGRQEITDAARALAEDVRDLRVALEDINESFFADYLYTKGLPEIDLLIRTSGEFRLSNFLLWQLSYAEIIVTRTLWPDFSTGDLDDALCQYRKRDRRFGGRAC
ncbi:MAG: isoprenyl transferase [Candidatus Omnitrophota bacterium]